MCDQLHLVNRDLNLAVSKRGLGTEGIHLKNVGQQQRMTFILTYMGMEN